MTDLERVKQFHNWLGDKYEIKDGIKGEQDFDKMFIVSQRGNWYWIFYKFKDDKLVDHYISE